MENKKGVAGENTGGTARRLISQLQSRGMTLEEIGRRIGRAPGTTASIASGEIENPPQQVITRLRAAL